MKHFQNFQNFLISEGSAPIEKFPASESGFLYHATNSERLYGIIEAGLVPHKPWDFTDQDSWPDGSTERRIYFSGNVETTLSFAPDEGDPVILRVSKNALPFKQERYTKDFYYTKKIKQELLEYFEAGHWIKLQG